MKQKKIFFKKMSGVLKKYVILRPENGGVAQLVRASDS